MPLNFDNGTGRIHPNLLQTGDLLFVGRLDAPTMLGKPLASTPAGTETQWLAFFQQIVTLEAATRAALILADRPSVMTSISNHLITVAGGYYSGHVAMVIVENDTPYVIEAGTQDYCSYRVAIHPYYVEDEDEPKKLMQMCGWANRRIFQNDKVWLRRLGGGLNDQQKTDIANFAKSLLGRPYGIFDTFEFADDSRLYCTDLAFKAYEAIGITLDNQRTWNWFFNSPTINKLGVQWPVPEKKADQFLDWADNASALLSQYTYGSLDTKPPVFSLPMLYYANQLVGINDNQGQPLYVKNTAGKKFEYGIG